MKPGKRWAMLFLIAFVISVSAIVLIVLWVNPDHPGSYDRAGTVDQMRPLLNWGIVIGVIGLVIVIMKFAVKSGIKEAQDESAPGRQSPPHPPGFPVVTRDAEYAVPPDGPGQYRIQGVHRPSKMDVSKYIQADSAANAKIKAELEDIVESSVTKAPL